MKLYVKLPRPVPAVQWFKPGDHPQVWTSHLDEFTSTSFIQTPEGIVTVTPGSWVLGPGYGGEYWPVQDHIFKETYEEYKDE